MRILFFGTTKGTACALHYFTAFVRLGHDVLPFDPEYWASSGPVERLAIRLRRGPTPAKVKAVSDTLVGICRNNRFDAVFVMSENYLGKETMEEIRKASPNPPLFLYHSHDNNFAPGILKPAGFFESLAAYDFVFTTKSQNVARYREIGQPNGGFIPSAYEPVVHSPVPAGYSRFSTDFDATFVGTFDRSRLPYLDAVGWDRLHVWGSDWTRWEGFATHKDRVVARPVYYFEFADVMSRSRCALGLLREEADDLHTQRTFEIPACGALQFAPRNDEILSFFEEDKEIVCFATLEELKDKITYYLKNEDARKRLAKRGYERCVKGKHTYVDRCGEMLSIATGAAKSPFVRQR